MAINIREVLARRPVIVALHLPPFPGGHGPTDRSMADIERFAADNARLLAGCGVDAVIVQDQTPPLRGDGDPLTTSQLALAARAARAAAPDLPLGIIANGHGARTPLAAAKASGAHFVRLKVYVGAMIKAAGIEEGCALDALRYRAEIGAEEVAIVADVFDRTGTPLGDTTLEQASEWAVRTGRADALVITGQDFNASLGLLDRVRGQRLTAPVFLGGSATPENAATAMRHADGVIASSALKRVGGSAEEQRDHPWDEEEVRRFVRACRDDAEASTPRRRADA